MAKIIITSEGSLVKEVELNKERMTIGRKPHNNVVLDNRSVSGEHATITLLLEDAVLEDLGSTNGTFINGQKIFRHKLVSGDKVTMGTFELTYMVSPAPARATGRVKVLNGVHAGKSLALNKPLTTLGQPGAAVVAITFAAGQYQIALIDGDKPAWVNGRGLDASPRMLSDGDQLNLAGTKMTFLGQ